MKAVEPLAPRRILRACGKRCHLGGTLSQVTVVRRALRTKPSSQQREQPGFRVRRRVCGVSAEGGRRKHRGRIDGPWRRRLSAAPPPLAARPDSGLAVGPLRDGEVVQGFRAPRHAALTGCRVGRLEMRF
jgi:hypothetical protein